MEKVKMSFQAILNLKMEIFTKESYNMEICMVKEN